MQCCEPIFVGRIGTHSEHQQSSYFVDVVPSCGLEEHDTGDEVHLVLGGRRRGGRRRGLALLGLLKLALVLAPLLELLLAPLFGVLQPLLGAHLLHHAHLGHQLTVVCHGDRPTTHQKRQQATSNETTRRRETTARAPQNTAARKMAHFDRPLLTPFVLPRRRRVREPSRRLMRPHLGSRFPGAVSMPGARSSRPAQEGRPVRGRRHGRPSDEPCPRFNIAEAVVRAPSRNHLKGAAVCFFLLGLAAETALDTNSFQCLQKHCHTLLTPHRPHKTLGATLATTLTPDWAKL